MSRLFEQTADRVAGLVRVASITGVDDAHQVQELDLIVLDGEDDEAVPHYQPLGLSFTPKKGNGALVITVGADAENRIAISVQARGKRPQDADPECGGVYSPKDGQWKLYIDTDGTVHLGAKIGAAAVARADRVDAELSRIWNVLTGWTVTPNDGGAALKTTAAAAVAFKQSTAADKVKAT